MEYQEKPILIMSKPDHFKIAKPCTENGSANRFLIKGYKEYIKDPVGFQIKALEQWTELHRILTEELGCKVILTEPTEGLDDQVFTADPSLSLVTIPKSDCCNAILTTVFSKFSNVERQNEVIPQQRSINQLNVEHNHVLSPHHFEGNGDNLYDQYRDIIWSGYTKKPGREGAALGRSDKKAHDLLQQTTKVNVVSLEMKNGFFHIDTAFAPLNGGHILMYPGAFSIEDVRKIRKAACEDFGLEPKDYAICTSPADAEKFACNVISVGNMIVMPECSERLQDRLREKGYCPITTPLDHLIMAGGAGHCSVNQVNMLRIPGGLYGQQKHADLKIKCVS